MTRYARPVFTNVPLHIIQRGNNRNSCFFHRTDYQVYLSMLAEASSSCACPVHAYVLMPNHIHLLVSPPTIYAPALLMKRLGQCYVQYVNRKYSRSGTLWQGRFRSCLVQEERYFLVCQRYIELNPVRADIVTHPIDYEWSSYKSNAHGDMSDILVPHATYLAIAEDPAERLASYRALCREAIPHWMLSHVRDATNGNLFFGSEQFSDGFVKALGRDASRRHAVRRKR